ncbi:MAG: FAD-dependent oxidoreductase [Neomegalonema sp.]|nr:FAD-dependent oxidoreductase [Neomegalonema sp.]
MLDDRYDLAFRLYPYARSADQDAPAPVRHPVVIVGGGPIGMSMALDLAEQGVASVILDDHEGVGAGSRAICFAKRALEIADRHGFGVAAHEKGVVWNLGKVFHGDKLAYEFNLLPEEGHKFPAFINLQQPYFEKFAVERIRELQAAGAEIDIRGKNRVDSIEQLDGGVRLNIMTPEGPYQIDADWLIACDGAGSPTRKMLGLDFDGRVFQDSFLIADVRMTADFPVERRFWFDPPFKSGASALLHKQPDDVWRIDFQIGWDVDRQEELKEANIRARVDQMLGPDIKYDIVWSSIYTFQCRRMKKFRHDRVIFAGDSAHQVSPFGARGANSGVQDVDNLGWKLALVMKGAAGEALLDSYEMERMYAADENILNSTRATDFITPKSEVSQIFRNAVLELAKDHAFARPLVNSGRLSLPSIYDGSELNSEDGLRASGFDAPLRTRPGAPATDAPLADGWLLEKLGGRFQILAIGVAAPDPIAFDGGVAEPLAIQVSAEIQARYLGDAPSAVYLLRPDQHIAARWATYEPAAVKAALHRALGK